MQSPLPVLALLCNALLWGLSWWPFRSMHAAGLHPLWATAVMYTLVCAVMLAARPGSLGDLLRQPALWLLALNSGINNMAFNWAVTVGDVVRVVLVFYLMPAWLVLLAWRILGERPTPAALARLGLAFGGVATLLQTAIAKAAGNAADVAQSMLVTAWNIAIASGGLIGGALLDYLGVAAFPPVLLVLLPLLFLTLI